MAPLRRARRTASCTTSRHRPGSTPLQQATATKASSSLTCKGWVARGGVAEVSRWGGRDGMAVAERRPTVGKRQAPRGWGLLCVSHYLRRPTRLHTPVSCLAPCRLTCCCRAQALSSSDCIEQRCLIARCRALPAAEV